MVFWNNLVIDNSETVVLYLDSKKKFKICSLLADLLLFPHISYLTGEWHKLLLMARAM